MSKSAYFILEIDIHDAEGMKPYLEKAGETVATFGGKSVVNSNNIIGLEGTAPKGRIVIIQFNDMATAQAWYQSPAYQELLQYRLKSANNRSYLVETLI